MSKSILQTTGYLDAWAEALSEGDDIPGTAAAIFGELNQIRLSVRTDEWLDYAAGTFRAHALHGLLLQEPLSRRAFEKPRGYAGDAAMIDLIYAPEDAQIANLDELTCLGRALYSDWIVDLATCRGVRARRAMIRARLNELAETREAPKVLSVASGHLREALRCAALERGAIGRFVALDQDAASLAVVAGEHGDQGVETVLGGVGDIVHRRIALGEFDFIYATGLYDYLPTPIAQQLTSALFAMLEPNGILVFANILPDVESRGYLEACLDWRMLHRSRTELRQLVSTLPGDCVGGISIYAEPFGQFAFVEAQRRAR